MASELEIGARPSICGPGVEGGEGLQGLTGTSWILACRSLWGLFVMCGVDGYLSVTRGRRPGLWFHLSTQALGAQAAKVEVPQGGPAASASSFDSCPVVHKQSGF